MNKLVVLCVDDEPTILDSLKIELRYILDPQYLIETAENGEEALELIEELLADNYEIPLIISDYIMPVLKGDELLKQVHHLSPKTLKIMLTGQADIEAVGNAIRYAKLYRYIAKPWHAEDLKLTVTEAINSYFQEKRLLEQHIRLQTVNQALLESNQEQQELIKKLSENEHYLTQTIEALRLAKFAIERAGDAILWINVDGGLEYANDTACRILQQERSALLSTNIQQLDLNFVTKKWDIYWQELQQAKHVTHESYYKLPDERTVPIDSSINYLEYDGVEYGLIFARDISCRKRIEDELEQYRLHLEEKVKQRTIELGQVNEQLRQDIEERERAQEALRKLSRAVEQSANIIIITDLHGKIEFVNPAFIESTGYCYEEVLGNNPRLLKSGLQSVSLYQDLWRTIKKGKVWQGELINKRKDGSLYWEFVNISPVKDANGHITHYVAIKENITERKKIEDQLQSNLKFLESLINTIPLPIFYKDNTGKYLGCNDAFANFLGISAQEIVGKTVYELYEKKFADCYHKADSMVIQTKEKQIYEAKIKRGDNAIRDVIFHKAAFWQPNGELGGSVGSLIDITERKEVEEQMKNQNVELLIKNEQLDAFARQLEEAQQEKLYQLNKAYERFVPREFLSLLDKESIIDIHLGDQVEKNMTILFSDIRDFTTLSENMTPKETFDFLNKYLGKMEPILIKHRGVIDKYIGDAIMALFPYSANDAVSGSIDMLRTLEKYNNELKEHQFQSLRIGIGLNTGPLMLGTIGGQHRMDGTVIADAVNLASRIEGLTKIYGTPLLITEDTYLSLEEPNQYCIRVIDVVKVKGKTEQVTVYEVFDANSLHLVELKIATQADFEQGFVLYHSEEFDDALQLFETVLQINPEDKVAQVYVERCLEAKNQIHTGINHHMNYSNILY